MGTLFTIVVFILVLGLLVLVHEFGHFYVAKRSGVQVDEFGIGFPPRIAAKKFGDTTYTLNAIPLGGFVKIAGVGEIEDEEGDGEAKKKKNLTGKKFADISKLRQFAILFAGIGMNLLLAVLLFFIVHLAGAAGDPNTASASAILSNERVVIVSVQEDSPAAEAGLEPGDVIVNIGGQTAITASEQLQHALGSNAGEQTRIEISRTGHPEPITSVQVTPESRTTEAGEEYVGIGVGLQDVATVRYPIHIAFLKAFETTFNILIAIIVSLAQLVGGIFTGTADTSGIAGPIGIAAITGEVARTGIIQLLQFSAILSINLAIFNLLPIPALDGGRILFTAIEAIRGKEVNKRLETIIHQFGFLLLMLLVLVVTLRDIANIW